MQMKDKKEKCFGCTACMTVCSNHAIRMVPDSEGFLYPFTDPEKCTQCGQCSNICPENGGNAPQKAMAFYSGNRELIKKSSSGGAFSSLADLFLADHPEGYIYGAVFSREMEVIHEGVQGKKEELFCGSKYVESDLGNCFSDIEAVLEQGEQVLFAGTPCQVAALNTITKHREQLLLIDLICDGVGSPAVWKRYLTFYEERNHAKVTAFSFRNKYFPYGRGVKIKDENGNTVEKSHGKDLYTKMYMSGLICRPSCYSCPFTDTRRVSDITIGDFHGLEEMETQFSEFPVSLVLTHTSKGEQYAERIQKAGRTDFFPMESCLQPRLLEPVKKSLLRNFIVKDYLTLSEEAFLARYKMLL